MKDKIINTYLQFKNNVWGRIFKVKPNLSLNGYEKAFLEEFNNSFEHRWRLSFPWGTYSKDEKLSYYDDSAVILTNQGVTLETFKKTKLNTFNKAAMKWAKGMVMSRRPFREYGVFEVVARVNPAKGVWSAPLWFVSANPEGSSDPYAVLPEPDVAEVYSSSNPYKMKVKSNLHYGKDYEKNAKSIGAKTHHVKDFVGSWVSYAMRWSEDRIEYYYNNRLVRVCTNKDVLERMKHGVHPIIGVGVKEGEEHEGSSMDVRSFKYFKEIN